MKRKTLSVSIHFNSGLLNDPLHGHQIILLHNSFKAVFIEYLLFSRTEAGTKNTNIADQKGPL